MAGELTPLRIDLATDRLRDAEDDPADERAPQRPEAADDRRPRTRRSVARPEERVERRASPGEHAGEGDGGDGERHGERVDALGRGCPSAAPSSGSSDVPRNARPSRRALEEQRERRRAPRSHTASVMSGSHPMLIVVVDLDARRLDAADVEPAGVGGVVLRSSAFWITIDSPKVATIWNAGSTPTTRSKTSRCST